VVLAVDVVGVRHVVGAVYHRMELGRIVREEPLGGLHVVDALRRGYVAVEETVLRHQAVDGRRRRI